MNISRGDICYIQSNFSSGSEQWGGRPAVIVSNEANNQFSSAVEVVYLTTQPKNDLPTHVTIRSAPRESIALCEQISTVALERVGAYAGHVTDTEMAQLEIAMMISLDIRYASSAPTEEHRIQNADPVSPPPRGRTAGRACHYDRKVRNHQSNVRFAAGNCAAAA